MNFLTAEEARRIVNEDYNRTKSREYEVQCNLSKINYLIRSSLSVKMTYTSVPDCLMTWNDKEIKYLVSLGYKVSNKDKNCCYRVSWE